MYEDGNEARVHVAIRSSRSRDPTLEWGSS